MSRQLLFLGSALALPLLLVVSCEEDSNIDTTSVDPSTSSAGGMMTTTTGMGAACGRYVRARNTEGAYATAAAS